jgi:anti-sigma-K factor RskA
MSLTMDQDRFEELCAGYVLDALDAEDRLAFERALAEGTPERRRFYEQMHRTVHHLPLAAETRDPPPYLKAHILQAIRAAQPFRAGITVWDRLAGLVGLSIPRVAVAVSLVLLVIAGGLASYTLSLRTAVRQQQQQLAELRSELARKEALLSVLAAPVIEMAIMNGLAVNPAGYGKIIWDPARRTAILQVSNLPPAPSDKDYQLWVIRDQVPVSAGVFAIRQPVQETFFRIENLAETNKQSINAFAITLEPAGGVPQPTGPMYLLGNPL